VVSQIPAGSNIVVISGSNLVGKVEAKHYIRIPAESLKNAAKVVA